MFYFDGTFFKRFLRVLKVLFPRWCSVNVFLFLFLLCVLLLQQVVVYHVGLIPSTYYQVLGEKDLPGFMSHTVYSLIITIAVAFLYATEGYVTSVFYVTSRRDLSRYLHEKYFQDIFYYQLNVLDDVIDNPDQRITQDGERLCKSFSEIIAKLLISPFVICFYMYSTWSSTGYLGPVCVVVFFIISTIINKFLMSPVVALVYKQEQLEGDFRFKHMQIRANAESAAFYRCGHLERQKTNHKLEALIQTQNRLQLKEYGLNFSIKLADYMGSILNYIILAFPIFGGVYDHLTPSELSSLISENAFITIYLIFSFTSLIDLAMNVTDMAGVTHRVGQMMEQLGEWNCHGDQLQDTVYEGHISSAFSSPPNSHDKILVRDLTFEIKAKCNILITGDSGCGKSSLLRVLDGLWQQRSGFVERKVIHGHRGVLYLPQKPFLTDGSLREQIVYPYKDWKYTGKH
ncbi:hypothetical protein LSH36_1g17037 [Paralvinella palmiformis]|uniref:ABC transmembrane type-1 domain-containing protein n=1 Tax=Paralvinella palmiformis TaxID=53620 RepID=A0AAD9NJC7_9ANNE|nr:hypothetical protein LSH36_1g17037 [Paralvinella palmiformis]